MRLAPRLGQFNSLSFGVAESVVQAAEGPTRKIIREERTKLADALIGAIPWASAGAISAIGTRYLVPDRSNLGKFVGYGTAAALVGVGSLLAARDLREASPEAATQQSAPSGGTVKSVSDQAAASLVAAAEPKIRQLVDEERARLSQSAQSGLPLVAAGALAAIATAVLSRGSTFVNVAGYSSAALMAAGGVWISLEKVKG